MEQKKKVERDWVKELRELGIDCARGFEKLNDTGKAKLIEFFKVLQKQDDERRTPK